MRRRIMWIGIAVLGVLALLLGAVIVRKSATSAGWTEIRSIEQLRERFRSDEDSIRLVLLLSPT